MRSKELIEQIAELVACMADVLDRRGFQAFKGLLYL